MYRSLVFVYSIAASIVSLSGDNSVDIEGINELCIAYCQSVTVRCL